MLKNIFAVILLTTLISNRSISQVYEKKVLHAGESLSAINYFLFPTFADGSVNLKNGGVIPEKMNFNLVLSQIQFIGPKGDSLVLSKPESIDSLHFGGSVFFYKDGYFEIPSGTDSVRLAIFRTVSYEPMKIGALGIATHGGGMQSYTSIIAENGEKSLTVNEDVSITEKTSFFFLKPDGEMQPASKSNLLKIFSNKKLVIENYLKSDKVNFNKVPDLIRALHFCVHG